MKDLKKVSIADLNAEVDRLRCNHCHMSDMSNTCFDCQNTGFVADPKYIEAIQEELALREEAA